MPLLDKDAAKKLYTAFTHAIAEEADLKALQQVSAMLADLQAIGIDVSLEWRNSAGEDGFNLAVGDNVSSWKQRTAGVLRIAAAEHLIALCSEVQLHSDEEKKWHRVPLLAVSLLDMRHQQSQTWRTKTFRLDIPEELTELQKFIIERAAVAEAIARNDSAGAFSSTRSAASFSVTAPRISLKPKGA